MALFYDIMILSMSYEIRKEWLFMLKEIMRTLLTEQFKIELLPGENI